MKIPSGWYFCVESSEIKPGQVLKKTLFGRSWALWRSEAGVLHISASVCPHLGSDLGKLGRVRGETLRCYSHRYQYNGDGDCVKTGNGARPCRTQGVLRQLPVHETGGFVMAWYDEQNAAPTWKIPDEVFESDGAPPFVRSQFEFEVPVQTLNEDNFDAGHLRTFHKVTDVVSSTPKVDGPRISITHDFKRHSILFEKPLPKPFSMLSRPIVSQYGSTLHGHGLTYSYIDIFNLGLRLQDFIWCTPISETRTLYTTFLRRTRSADPSLKTRALEGLLHRLIFPMTVWRMRQEHILEGQGFWENQSHVPDPILTDQERELIGPYRKWCKQFEAHEAHG